MYSKSASPLLMLLLLSHKEAEEEIDSVEDRGESLEARPNFFFFDDHLKLKRDQLSSSLSSLCYLRWNDSQPQRLQLRPGDENKMRANSSVAAFFSFFLEKSNAGSLNPPFSLFLSSPYVSPNLCKLSCFSSFRFCSFSFHRVRWLASKCCLVEEASRGC